MRFFCCQITVLISIQLTIPFGQFRQHILCYLLHYTLKHRSYYFNFALQFCNTCLLKPLETVRGEKEELSAQVSFCWEARLTLYYSKAKWYHSTWRTDSESSTLSLKGLIAGQSCHVTTTPMTRDWLSLHWESEGKSHKEMDVVNFIFQWAIFCTFGGFLYLIMFVLNSTCKFSLIHFYMQVLRTLKILF